ncbi:transcription initiation factor TFIID subunit 4 isoform X1 [Hylaeus anthracinus]|uniref:transcription initiation factor TFIID subunit 4 isoform X1 n=1 Tax=Hylaeus volcanicus TaxID=313075 RepID=UPI0023B7E900|nr:transcription initiation factor TFIID subunit 4 isoform X1 [Hylaeus volcanicus]XP_054012642.1 transcription initiation factor TFIID subunit 4 isoform X1 [Hylaeus anthracinus]
MASAKFLEEALSTDVDESAVNAIVGSLETQLVTSTPAVSGHQASSASVSQQNHQVNSGISNGGTINAVQPQKHGVSNGGGATTVNSLMTQEVTKSITTSTLLPVNVVTSNTVAPQVTTQQQQQHTQSAVPPATYINQVTTNQVTSNQTTHIPSLTKAHEPVKIIYPTVGQVIATTGVANVNNKLSFPTQTVGQLANGTLGITSQAVLQTTSNVVTNVSSVSETGSQTVASVNKPTGTALVIKTSVAPSGMVSVPMSVPVSVAGNAVSTALQGKAGVTSTIVPSNVQILNVNAMRPGTPVAGQQAGKQVGSRVVIGQHMIGTGRPGAPGITLQTLHSLQPGTQGHILLKTETGQYQLIRVGPPPTAGTPAGTAVTPNSIAGNAVVAAPSPGTAYRLASVPAVSRLNTQFTGPPLATLRKTVQTVAATITTATTTPVTVTAAATTTPTPPVTTVQTVQTPTPRQTTDNTKEKCRKFLANLLELSSREPRAVERNVRTLIQELIDTKVEPEEFCDRLERLLNASPQPCLIGFLKKSLPLLRQSLVTKELVIEGIKPPPANVVFPVTSATPIVTQQNQLRPTVAVTAATIPVTPVTAVTTQIRVMTPIPAATTTVPRPAQPVQQRLIRPVTTVVRSPTAYTVKSTVAVSGIRPTAPTVQKPPVTTTIVKTITTTTQGKTVNTTTTVNKAVVPSFVPKPTTKEKEKKTFSSAGYTGDDDINDVAAMGGVNLAEESQRILGSTEFVGTQIRSCKDEVFLHMTPLQQRIKQIVSNYGLEEPNQEVAALISHAAQERLKNLVEKLAVIAEHRIDLIKVDPRYEVTQDVRAQLKFLEDLDKVERRRHEEQERELLLRAAKSRAKTEDPEQAKLKAKAKEMQRAEMEELRQREANLTALQAIGPRKKPKLDVGGSASSPGSNSGLNTSSTGINRQMPMRPRLKRVNFRDLLFLLEQEKETCRSTMLYKSYLK